ncbi:hypothetical protein [Gelidibacter sp.]|uniref:hypothetical protein n=1 Tax=Gelidibacter sp. TaxID=2018083 RepID=UPI002B9195C3|nr:hypothetical protein [Gelidibacter sp.]HUH27311.1 hypothetical protein [Gelidibacter sp.]
MTINEKLLENFFSNNLTEAELQEFDNQYATDKDFKKEVDFLKNVRVVSETEDHELFKNQLANYETEISPKKASLNAKWLKPMAALAAILIVALSVTFLANKDTKDHLFSTYFEPSKNVSAPIVRAEIDGQLAGKAFIAYSEADYKHAIPIFQKAFKETENPELLFYEGNALLAQDNAQEAIEVFKTHLSYSDALTNRTHWYLALAYLKANQLDEAKQELKTFINSEETFKKTEAKSLLKKLN